MIVLDFDGTLVNSEMRCSQLFQELIAPRELTLSKYRELKTSGLSNEEILRSVLEFNSEDISRFRELWMGQIEDPVRLLTDELIPGAENWLHSFSKTHTLLLCTARQNAEIAHTQIGRLGLSKYFKKILVTSQQTTKSELIRSYLGDQLPNSGWVVGDSPDDINTAKSLGWKSCAVLTGFKNRETLTKYKPDIIVQSLEIFVP